MDLSKHSPRVKSCVSFFQTSKPTKTLSKLPAPLDEHSSFNTSWETRRKTWNRHFQKLVPALNFALVTCKYRSYETQAVGSRKLLDWPRKNVSAPFPRPRDIPHQVPSVKKTTEKMIRKGHLRAKPLQVYKTTWHVTSRTSQIIWALCLLWNISTANPPWACVLPCCPARTASPMHHESLSNNQ